MRRFLQQLFRSSLALVFVGLVGALATASTSTAQVSILTASIDHIASIPLPNTSLPGAACGFTEREQALAAKLVYAPEQQRPRMRCNTTLMDVARQRAKDMAARDYFSHTTPDGLGPNHLVRKAGYALPARYSSRRSANNVESLGAGYATADGVWQALLESPSHRTHLLAEYPFYTEQVEFGIGYARGGEYGHYWVIITAQPARSYTAAARTPASR